jgi:hypothetical protein
MPLYCAFADFEYGSCSQHRLLRRLSFVLAAAAGRDRQGFHDAGGLVLPCWLQQWCKAYFKNLEISAGGMVVPSY